MATTFKVTAKKNVGKISKGATVQLISSHSKPDSKEIKEAVKRQFGIEQNTIFISDFEIEKIK